MQAHSPVDSAGIESEVEYIRMKQVAKLLCKSVNTHNIHHTQTSPPPPKKKLLVPSHFYNTECIASPAIHSASAMEMGGVWAQPHIT